MPKTFLFRLVILIFVVLIGGPPALMAQLAPHPGLLPEARPGRLLSGLGSGADLGPSEAPAAGATAFLSSERWDSLHVASRRAPRQLTTESSLMPEVHRALRTALREGSIEERMAAAHALARLEVHGARGELMAALRGAPALVAESVVLALGRLGDRGAKELLEGLVRDDAFGRAALGSTGTPVPEALQVAALLALGLLPEASEDRMTIEIVLASATQSARRHLAASLALGLPNDRPFAVRDRALLSARLEDTGSPAQNRGTLMVSLVRRGGLDSSLELMLRGWLRGDDVELARAAAAAYGCDLAPLTQETARVLEDRARDLSDVGAAGLALVALARRGDAALRARVASWRPGSPTHAEWVDRAQREFASLASEPPRPRMPEALLASLSTETERFRLGCLAQRLANSESPATTDSVLDFLATPGMSARARSFAIGALGLRFDRQPSAGLARLRAAAAYPGHDPVLLRCLSWL
ncbi:MAG: HEAT repeat domain-containing protein [Planctomycetes bacterium]|nr:HEAT repeat domain-containing protein [Planctomycetota bacterium]